MDSLTEVIVPTFVNAHLFWIIQKKDIALRSAMNKVMRAKRGKKLQNPSEVREDQMVAVNINDLWARGIIDTINTSPENEIKYVCWLPDYGITQIVNYVFALPEGLEKCPQIAKQASLHNVVNLTTDLILGDSGYELRLKKTIDHIEGVRKVALDCMEEAQKLFFSVIDEDIFSFYGDIICLYQEDARESLTDFLINKNLLAVDEKMFQTIDSCRDQFKETYFTHSPNWQLELDKTEKSKLSGIFNRDKRESMEFFNRKSMSHT